MKISEYQVNKLLKWCRAIHQASGKQIYIQQEQTEQLEILLNEIDSQQSKELREVE